MKNTTKMKVQNTIGPIIGATRTNGAYAKSPNKARINVSNAAVKVWYSSNWLPNVVTQIAEYLCLRSNW